MQYLNVQHCCKFNSINNLYTTFIWHSNTFYLSLPIALFFFNCLKKSVQLIASNRIHGCPICLHHDSYYRFSEYLCRTFPRLADFASPRTFCRGYDEEAKAPCVGDNDEGFYTKILATVTSSSITGIIGELSHGVFLISTRVVTSTNSLFLAICQIDNASDDGNKLVIGNVLSWRPESFRSYLLRRKWQKIRKHHL